MKKTTIGFLVLSVFFLAPVAYALDLQPSPWKSEATKGEQARAKFEFGLKNVFLGWTEILTEPYEARQGGLGEILRSLPEGIINAVLDTAGGAIHFVTSPCPHFDVPLPEGGTNIAELLG